MSTEKGALDLITRTALVAFEKAFQQLVGFTNKISGDLLGELG